MSGKVCVYVYVTIYTRHIHYIHDIYVLHVMPENLGKYAL